MDVEGNVVGSKAPCGRLRHLRRFGDGGRSAHEAHVEPCLVSWVDEFGAGFLSLCCCVWVGFFVLVRLGVGWVRLCWVRLAWIGGHAGAADIFPAFSSVAKGLDNWRLLVGGKCLRRSPVYAARYTKTNTQKHT